MDFYHTLIFSKTVVAFIEKATALTKQIVSKEMGLKIGRKNFYHQNISYPIRLVSFEHPSQLGFFDGQFYEIGLNKRLVFESEKIVCSVLKHELAHYITFIECGENIFSHGKRVSKCVSPLFLGEGDLFPLAPSPPFFRK